MNAKKKFEKMLSMILALAMVFTVIGVVPAKAEESDHGVVTKDNKYYDTWGSVSGNTSVVFFAVESGQIASTIVSSGKLSYAATTNTVTINGFTGAHISIWGDEGYGSTNTVNVILKGVSKLSQDFCPDVPCIIKAEAGASLTFVYNESTKENLDNYVTLDTSVKETKNADGTYTYASTTAAPATPASPGSDNKSQGGSSTADNKDAATATGAKDTLPAVKTTLESKDGKANYTVTKSAAGAVEVAYTAPVKKNASSVVIQPTVILKDGTEAKVTSISASAFKGNKKIKSVTIGKNITNIGANAFSGCKNLKKITFKTTKVKFGKKVFKNVKKGCIVYYPKSLKGSKLKKFKTTLKTAGLKSAKYKKK